MPSYLAAGLCKPVLLVYKHKIKIFVSCFWQCPWSFARRAAHLKVSLLLSSPRCNTQTRELLAGAEEKGISPTRGVQDSNQGFFPERKQKNESVATPGLYYLLEEEWVRQLQLQSLP